MSQIVMLDEEVYFKTISGYEKKKIVRLEYFGEYFYDEDGRQQSLEECFPITKENEAVMSEAQKTSEDGWKMIRHADTLRKDGLESFPKGHWAKLLAKKIKEYSKVSP